MDNIKVNKIINEELIVLLKEMIDPNGGNLYQPPGLDPKVVKLYENAEDFYQSSLDDDYWKEISELFPKYNIPGEDDDKNKAINHIIIGMKTKYPDENWGEMENALRQKIGDGIT